MTATALAVLLLLPLAAGCGQNALLSWAQASGCKLGPVKIAPSTVGGGLGMFATADISTDELLFAVPCELHIGLETALGDPDCGAQFQEDGYALGAICAFVAKQYLCGGTQFGPYIASLNFDRNATDVLHWTVDEMKLLVTSGATFVEAEKLRDDAEDLVGYALNLEPLRRCVQEATKITDEDALDESIAEAVISAHASVLSRSFSVPGASWSNARELIPVLDALQHGTAGPTIWHDTENLDGMGECTVARARQPIASGEELWNWYGAHPDFVFATQFGFVPSAGAPADEQVPSGVAANRACLLNLADGFEDAAASCAKIGPSIALSAQMRVAQMRESGETALSGDDAVDEEDARTITKFRIRRRIRPDETRATTMSDVDGQLEMARLLMQAGAWAEYPLRFVVSNELIGQLAADMDAKRYPSTRHGGAALVACARLCALEPKDLLSLGGGGEEWREGEAVDPNTQLDEVLKRLTVDGWISDENDRRAAELVRAAARRQLESQQAHDQQQQEGSPPSSCGNVRDECSRLARQARASEMYVLEALADGGAAELFMRDRRLNRPIDPVK